MKKININRDVRKYKEKLVGPFSAREAFCLVVGFLCFYLIKAIFFTDIEMMSDQTGFLLIAVMIPFAIVGWGKFYGMYIEKFAKCALPTLLSPKVRTYKCGYKIKKKVIKTKKSKDKEMQRFK